MADDAHLLLAEVGKIKMHYRLARRIPILNYIVKYRDLEILALALVRKI
ncbi:MAG: hypothetical protein Q8Q13_01050 [bacterium]|nr:hypothetical protein [bacterium]